jgi:hypothetical protein
MFEAEKKEIDFALDSLAMKAFDAGWNSVLDIINEAITEKHMTQDKIAVEVIVWLRNRIAGEDA